MTASSVGVRFVAVLALASVTACGPGPLPPENPAQSLATAPEPVPVHVESTVEEAAPAPAATTTLEAAPPPVEPPVVVPAERGLLTPESVLYDAENDRYVVSSINGSPNGVDNNGFISLVNPDGSVHQLDFIVGGKKGVTLNAPKGLALHDGTLYVADLTVVRKFDAKTGAPRGVIQFPKSTFINDVAVDSDGTLYVSDTGIKIAAEVTPTGTDALYKVSNGKVSVVAKGAQLNRPNGVALVNGSLVAVTFGNKQLMEFDAKGNTTSTTELPATTLDGVVALPNGQVLVSSWEKQTVYIGTLGGTWSVAAEGLPAPADIGFDTKRNRILVPLFMANELRFVSIVVPHAAKPPLATPAPTSSDAAPPTASATATSNVPVTSNAPATPTASAPPAPSPVVAPK